MTARQTFVYFIAPADKVMVKIGCSTAPVARLSQLMAWSFVPLEILAAVPGTTRDEYALHRRYLDSHSHKEWFRSTAEMLADIEAIARLGELPTHFKGAATEKRPLPADYSARRTPEFRARISEVHKARWARERRERALLRAIGEYLAAHRMSARAFNAASRCSILLVRDDGTYFIGSSQERVIAQAEAFVGLVALPSQARAAS